MCIHVTISIAGYYPGGMLNSIILIATIVFTVSRAAEQIFYVSPDNSIDANCSFQPCATLSQYLLDNNGSLPVVSNVEYYFLPGEHHVPRRNVTLQYLHNFTFIGNSLLSTVLVIDLYVCFKIESSINFVISNMAFKTFDKQTREISYLSQFMLSNCFYCKLRNLSFLDYGLFCKNLYGKSYLSDIVMDISECHYTGITLHYGERSQFDYNRYTEVVFDGIFMYRESVTFKFNLFAGIHIVLNTTSNNVTFTVSNSHFQGLDLYAILIDKRRHAAYNTISIKNCKFQDNKYIISDTVFFNRLMYHPIIYIGLSKYNMILSLSHCQFVRNEGSLILAIHFLMTVIIWIQIVHHVLP